MLSEETNIYVPIYTAKPDSNLLKSSNDGNWCKEDMASIKTVDLNKLSNDVKVSRV